MNEELKEAIRQVVREELRESNPVYKELSDVPIYWRYIVQDLLDQGILDGGTVAAVDADDINLPHDVLMSLIIMRQYVERRLNEERR